MTDDYEEWNKKIWEEIEIRKRNKHVTNALRIKDTNVKELSDKEKDWIVL